jgi:hypothetical protein
MLYSNLILQPNQQLKTALSLYVSNLEINIHTLFVQNWNTERIKGKVSYDNILYYFLVFYLCFSIYNLNPNITYNEADLLFNLTDINIALQKRNIDITVGYATFNLFA